MRAPIDRQLNLSEVGMPRSFSIAGILCAAIASASCSDAAAPPDLRPGPPPTKIVITAVTVENLGVDFGSYQVVRIGLRNDGGPGTYYLQFRRYPSTVGGVASFQESEALNAPTGFNESRVFEALDLGSPDVVAVFTRPANTINYVETDCKPLRAAADCNGFWDY